MVVLSFQRVSFGRFYHVSNKMRLKLALFSCFHLFSYHSHHFHSPHCPGSYNFVPFFLWCSHPTYYHTAPDSFDQTKREKKSNQLFFFYSNVVITRTTAWKIPAKNRFLAVKLCIYLNEFTHRQ